MRPVHAALAFSAVALAALAAPALAQSTATAREGLRLDTYALASTVRPAFGIGQTNFGVTAGLDVSSFHLTRSIVPSLDLRLLASRGNVSNQFFFGGGPRLTVDLGRVQPFGEVLVGEGLIHFPNTTNSYTHDNSFVPAYGGGLDVRLSRDLALRAEALGQIWKLGTTSTAFHPLAVSVGVRYTVHLRGRHDPDL